MSTRTFGFTLLLVSLIPCVTPAATAAEPDNAATSDPALAAFLRAVVETNPRLNAARAAVEASFAFEDAAERPLYNPTIQLDAENADSDTRSLGLSQTIDWGGKRRARTEVAAFDRRAVEAEYTAVQWQLIVDLLSGLAEYQTESDRLELSDERVAVLKDFADLAGQRFQAGDLGQIEFDLASLTYAQARMLRATAAAGVAEAQRAVSSLAPASPPPQWPRLGTALPILAASLSNAQELVLALPEVRASRMRQEQAGALIELRERERRLDPTLSLRGGTEDDSSLVGVTVTIPIPVRNRFNNEVVAASAQYRQARQIATDISRAAYARLVSAGERYRLAHGAWQDWEATGGVSLQRQTRLLRRLWEAGEISTTDFLIQIRQTLDTQESALDLRQAYWRAWFEWLVASGRVDRWLNLGDWQ